MSDSVCGPSNALKNLGNHVNRDQSLHQDRARPGPLTSNFRSAPVGPNHESGFQAFLQDSVALPEIGVPEIPVQSTAPSGPGMPYRQPVYTGPVTGPAARPVHPVQGFSHFPVASAGSNWAQEFSAMHGTSQMPAVSPGGYAASPFAQPQLTPQAPDFQSLHQPYMQRQPLMQPHYAAPPPAQALVMPQVPGGAQTGANRIVVAGLTEAELEARFAQLEAEMGLLDEDEAAVVEKEVEDLAAGIAAQDLATTKSPTTAEPVPQAEEPQTIAAAPIETAPAQTAEQATTTEQVTMDEFARTAEQIVHTLDAHPSERFRESAFLSLMRRIQAREVTVQGDVLYDASTGRAVESSGQAALQADLASPVRTEAQNAHESA